MNETQNPSIEKRWIEAGRGFVEDFQESLMRRHDEAMEVRSLEEVLAALAQVAQILTPALERLASRFYRNDTTIPDYNVRRKLVDWAEELSQSVAKGVVPDANKHAARNYEIEGLSVTLEAFAKFDKAIASLKKTCPEANADMLARTSRNILNGQVQPAKELVYGHDRS